MWILLAQLSALSDSFKDIVFKRALNIDLHPILASWCWIFFAFLTMLPLFLFIELPVVDNVFWLALAVRVVLDFIGVITYSLALKKSQLSDVLPLTAFAPIVVLISSIFINSEIPSIIGVIGIAVVFLGVYVLNSLKSESKNYLHPIISIFSDSGSRYMILTMIFFGTNSSLHKFCVSHLHEVSKVDNVIFNVAIGYLGISILLTIAVLFLGIGFRSVLNFKTIPKVIPIGVLGAIGILLQITAVNSTLASFATSANRTSIVYSAILASLIFKERIGKKLIPIIMILIGVFIIAISRG